MKEQIENLIKEALKNLGIHEEVAFSVEHPEDFKNGDYSTNVAMVCAKKVGKNPKELAEKIVIEIQTPSASGISPLAGGENTIEKVEAVNGFVNFYLSREFFTESVNEILEKGEDWGKNEILNNKKVMVEYTQPNPFKPFHIGHLMSNAIGESISRIVEFSGAKTIRANYQGDVGPHVAKAIYILKQNPLPTLPLTKGGGVSGLANYIGECYSRGSNLYDTDEKVKKEIDEINKKIYDKSDDEINKIYDWGKKITLEAFEEIYKLLGTKFDYYFFESDMAPAGEKIVRENVGKVFEESDGAIVFHGENYDKKLHTRVFINSQGLPTYETKEIGLTMTKFEKENPDISIVTTAVEQAEYMKVVQKAISLMHPDLEKKMLHITHGMMRLATGKMSSRKGNVVTGESLLWDAYGKVLSIMKNSFYKRKDIASAKTEEEAGEKYKKDVIEVAEKVGVAALKYSILRSSLGSDIVYDFEKSISFDGDSGPYLQYTAVRANSILKKTPSAFSHSPLAGVDKIPEEVTDLEKLLYQFAEIVEYSYETLQPHHIATYLTKLASEFNNFYGNTKILPARNATHNVAGGESENKFISYHLNLVKAFYQTMKNGLWLLGIETPERM